jgi:hypothetical protein
MDKAIINIAYGVLKRDFARQKSKHEQKLSMVPSIVNKQPIIKNDIITYSSAFTPHDEFII